MTDDLDDTKIDDDDSDKLIIALDFGTTYSGVAYAFTSKPDSVYLVEEWPGAPGKAYQKCPTLVKYDSKKGLQWGCELDRTTSERIEGVKLLLDPDQSRPVYVSLVNTEAELKRLGKPAIEVATDYISAIFKHAKQHIAGKYSPDYLDMLPKKYVLSVPAVWSEKAQKATLQAARNAGITNVELVKEPEAAALYTLHHMKNKGLEVGDAFVLCDAGGGTVDLISYEILQIQPLQVKELVSASGGIAGSLMLNKRFEEWIKDVVGERAYLDLKEKDAYRRGMRHFDETIKPGFQSAEDEDQYVSFPRAKLEDNEAKGLINDTLVVTGKTLHNLFDPLFKDIDKLVKEQVNDVRIKRMKDNHPKGYQIKAIFLVGGFGSSNYLCESIKSAYPDTQVIQPNDAWSAIVRGAVMFHLPSEAEVVSSIARKHYGISARAPYDPSEDEGQSKIWDDHEERYRVQKLTWYITRGDDMLRSRKIEFPFYRSYEPHPSATQLKFDTTLWECSLDKQPRHPGPSVVKNCTITSDLSKVPDEAFEKRTKVSSTTGVTTEYWRLHFLLSVEIQSGPMKFSLICKGKNYGEADAQY
ncbi:hypothetical protein A1O3_07680 [Capronia epimyces CBS 606.96]|uniref:Hsp70-like protein n=1 Tax=Capronia epimyces CBS 606.96 TaxID=1182542 RepID=W9YGJ3_9EURO|nr:uncharacterized protein A1O3_07680 [Capronia epimyces CBS 606.96]EXJ81389.1 hypothetical protein A1O3_07680 [Capronia epimyces CBS 606.96]